MQSNGIPVSATLFIIRKLEKTQVFEDTYFVIKKIRSI
jgi:hypothetical protein